MTGDHMLRLVYFEALNALHEAGGELPADPEALADELMLPAEEIARCLPILAAIADRGGRGGLVVEDGMVRNPRVVADLQAEAAYRSEQATFGRASADSRRSKGGSAQPKGRPRVPLGSPEPVPNPPLPSPTPTPENGPPLQFPPASRVGSGAVDSFRPGDVLRDGREVLEVDDAGKPTVVRRGPSSPPTLTREATEALDRVVRYASELGYRFDRDARRRLRQRLLGGETEAQLLAPYRRQREAVEALEELQDPPPGEAEDDDPELGQALRLLGPPAPDGLAAAGRAET
jgi:hypothetical protein